MNASIRRIVLKLMNEILDPLEQIVGKFARRAPSTLAREPLKPMERRDCVKGSAGLSLWLTQLPSDLGEHLSWLGHLTLD
jgi:hypothetical protein